MVLLITKWLIKSCGHIPMCFWQFWASKFLQDMDPRTSYLLPKYFKTIIKNHAKNASRSPPHLFASFPKFQCSVKQKNIPERTPMSRNIANLKLCTRNRQQIRPDGTQMSKRSWFGGVLGPCVGVLEPSGPKNPPGCILGRETTFVAHPRGLVFGTIRVVFVFCFFWLPFRLCDQNGIL